MNEEKLQEIQNQFSSLFSKLENLNSTIKTKLEKYADGKILKGDELIGWLGEIYGKVLFNGTLVDDSFEHDFETDNFRYSVKARKGFNNGWTKTSLIRKINGKDSPTHLLFVHFNNDFSVDRIWNFKWDDLIKEKRLKEKYVREVMIGWQFTVRDEKDKDCLIIDNRN